MADTAKRFSTPEVKPERYSSPELGSPSTWVKNRKTRQPHVQVHYPSSPPATQCDKVDAVPSNGAHQTKIPSDATTEEEGYTDILAAMQAAHAAELQRVREAHDIELRAIRTAFDHELRQRRNAWTTQKTLTDTARERYANERTRRLEGAQLLKGVHSDLEDLQKRISDLCGCKTGVTKRRRTE